MRDERPSVPLQAFASRLVRRRAMMLSGVVALTALLSVVVLPLMDASASGTKKPEAVALPVVSPTAAHPYVVESGTTGSWANGPTSLSYQWQRCSATGKECVNITGATGPTYTPGEADGEHTLVLNVTATNSEGSTSASSAATGKVPPVGQVTEYKASAFSITAGPGDGNIWFTSLSGNKINRITPSGTITAEYPLPAKSETVTIVAGPDGNLWFTEFGSSKIGRMGPSDTLAEYALPKGSEPWGITVGPDGDLWFTEPGTSKIGKITTSGTITEYTVPNESDPWEIAAGPDGNLWFTEYGASKIGKITTSGTITEYALPKGSEPWGIAAGPDGNLWFTDSGTSEIGKITTSGAITEYSWASSTPTGITAGPDGRLWVLGKSGTIGRVTTSGSITEYTAGGSASSGAIAVGPDENLWFTGATTIGKIVP